MASSVVMPKLGLTMKQGKIVKWFKKEGDPIQVGEKLFEVATDKLTNEIESNEAGVVLKLLAAEGDAVPCLEAIAVIGRPGEDISSLLAGKAPGAEASQKASEEAKQERKQAAPEAEKAAPAVAAIKGGRIIASPATKKLAEERGIDLALVQGTGPNGRIVLEDVEKYEARGAGRKASPMAAKTAQALGRSLDSVAGEGRILRADVLRSEEQARWAAAANPVETRVPMTQMRKVIAARMSESWQVSPAVTYDMVVDMTELKKIKEALKEAQKLTYTDFLVKIISQALLEFPLLNASLDGEEIITRNYVNMGVAVAIDNGLVVPVIRYAHTKGLTKLSEEVRELAHKAKTGQLSGDEMQSGTFTITNLGMYGMESFSPIINQPEVAILGVNAMTDTPVFVNGNLVSKPLMKLSLSADHRVADGAVAAQFLYRVKQYIEKPSMLLL